MTKKKDRGRGPIFQSTSDGRIEEWRAPTLEELENLILEVTKRRRAQPKAMPEFWAKLDEVLRGCWRMVQAQRPWPQEQKDLFRWALVCKAIEIYGWSEAFDRASDMAKGTPFAVGRDMMEVSYKKFQRKLPPERRRQRTYRSKRQVG